jgi:hypothetical protein
MINKSKIKKYIRSRRNNMTQKLISGIYVMIKDPLPKHISIEDSVAKITGRLPDHFLRLVDVIYVGDFDFLREKNVNAVFMENAIYITNDQDDQEDMLDDVFHEFAHAVEKVNQYEIYSDGAIESEFLSKRHKLEVLLNYEGHKTDQYNFSNPNFDQNLDNFLYKEVGYEKIRNIGSNMFLGAYSVTSLSEYFSVSFEKYYLNDRKMVRLLTPAVFEKLELLHNNEEKNETQNYY